jgi:energy-coupling factor transport system ATP-binding protein
LGNCSRVLVMRHGSIEADGLPATIFADAVLLERCHLDLPLSYQQRQQPLP